MRLLVKSAGGLIFSILILSSASSDSSVLTANRRKFPAAPSVSSDLESAIRKALANGRLSCLDAWKIADQLQIKRLDVCAACEKLKIKVKPCQLGAF